MLTKSCPEKSRKIPRKKPVPESLFNQVAGFTPATLLRLQYRCFPVNFSTFFRPAFLHNTYERLLPFGLLGIIDTRTYWRLTQLYLIILTIRINYTILLWIKDKSWCCRGNSVVYSITIVFPLCSSYQLIIHREYIHRGYIYIWGSYQSVLNPLSASAAII